MACAAGREMAYWGKGPSRMTILLLRQDGMRWSYAKTWLMSNPLHIYCVQYLAALSANVDSAGEALAIEGLNSSSNCRLVLRFLFCLYCLIARCPPSDRSLLGTRA